MLGAMMMIAYGWSPAVPRVWFWLGVIAGAYCVLRVVLDWRARAEAAIKAADAVKPTPEDEEDVAAS